jgi:hypothetical protein
MRVYVIDAGNSVPEQRRGIIGIDGPGAPTLAEKLECIETVTRLADQGWAIAARLSTPIGRLSERAAKSMGVPILELEGLQRDGSSRLPLGIRQIVRESRLTL